MEAAQTFKGKVAIVTGGGSGIGKACAQLLIARGASVVVAGRDEKVDTVATGEQVLPIKLDLAEEDQVKKNGRTSCRTIRAH